jgi:YHS domain-containing protein
MNMKLLKTLTGAAVLSGILAASTPVMAADQAKSVDAKSAKPYTLKTCIVSGEKLDGGMGKPYVFVEQGQEIKLCCKSCLKDFKKDPAKYLKKLAEAQKDGKEVAPSAPAHGHSEHQH